MLNLSEFKSFKVTEKRISAVRANHPFKRSRDVREDPLRHEGAQHDDIGDLCVPKLWPWGNVLLFSQH